MPEAKYAIYCSGNFLWTQQFFLNQYIDDLIRRAHLKSELLIRLKRKKFFFNFKLNEDNVPLGIWKFQEFKPSFR